MKKKLAVLMLLIVLIILPGFAQETSYYVSFYPNVNLYYPGDKIQVYLNIYYYYLDIKGDFQEDISFDIYKMPDDLAPDKYQEYASRNYPVDTLNKTITLKDYGYDYWQCYDPVDLPGMESGIYYITLTTPHGNYSTTVRVSSLSLTSKITKESILLFVQDRKTGKTIENADISISLSQEVKKFKTDKEGFLKLYLQDLHLEGNNSCRIVALSGKNSAEVTVSVPLEQELFKGYIYTDRPVYRPEQDVHFKGILRTEKGDKLSYVSGEEIEVLIQDPQGAELYKEKLKTDEYGNISGKITLVKEPPLGRYNIYCTHPKGQANGYFQVEEYRKPEFEIKINPEKENYVQGDNMTFNMEVNYYFGAPVPDTEYTYEIYRNYYYPYYWSYWWQEELMYYDPYYTTYSSYGGEFIKSDTGKTDKNGKATFSCEATKIDYDATYMVKVRMVDESRREVTGSASVLITRGAFYLTLKPEKYYYEPGDKANIKIEAKDYSGNPVKTDLTLKARYERYDQKANTWTWEEGQDVKLKTDEQGLAFYDYKIKDDGYYEITCNALDQNENQITTYGYLYCYSWNGYYNWYNRFSNVEIIPDKDYYEPGDKAGFFIVCPHENIKALVTVEGEDVYYEKVMDFSNRTAELKLDITEKYSPNFFVTVDFFYEGVFYHHEKKIICPSTDKFLNVSIEPDKEKYKPRDTAKFIVKTTDQNGKPVSSQVTMGLADESVYAVMSETTPNIQKFFYGTKNNQTYTYGSDGSVYPYYYNYYGYEDEGEGIVLKDQVAPSVEADMKTSADTGAVAEQSVANGGGGETPVVQPDFTREYFPDTAYFNPGIITDQNGVAEINIEMPDSLTTWRATARAVSKDTKVGENTEKIIVTKDLLARLITTRFYTERDEAVITGIVHNYLNSEKTVYASLDIDGGIKILDSNKFKVNIPPDGSVPIDWKVKVERAGEVKIKLTALTDEESDAVEMKIPVLPHGTEQFVAVAGSTSDTSEEELIFPEGAEKGSAKCLIILEPSIASTVLTSLDYLIGYPYGCVEQTMSRFLPNVIVANTLGELDLYDENINKELPEMVKQGFERLYNFHHSDGGWGWWENDESHPYMTAYVVYGLSLAKEAGYSVDENKVSAAISWMRQNYDKQEDLNTKAYMAFAVSTAGENCNDWLKELYKKKDKLNSYSVAVLAISLHKAGMDNEADEMVKFLEDTASASGTTACWSGQAYEHGWTDNKVEITSYCLKALLAVKPESKLIPKVVRYLAFSRNGNYWYSTKDTAAAVMSLTGYIKISKELNPDFTADLYFNGTKIKTVEFTKEDVGKPGERIEIPFDQGLMSGKNTIKFQMNGKGMLYYAAYLKYYTDEENVKAQDSGIKIKRTFYLAKPSKDNKEPELVKLGSSGEFTVSSQDIILVKLEITGENDYEYVIIEDPKPAGCEYDTEQRENLYDWNYWYVHREERDEKIAFFSTYYWAGNQEITYRLRAETPGKFHVMPGRAYLMYSTEVGGNSDEVILNILESEDNLQDQNKVVPEPVSEKEIKNIQQEKEAPESKAETPNNTLYIGAVIGILTIIVLSFMRKGKGGC